MLVSRRTMVVLLVHTIEIVGLEDKVPDCKGKRECLFVGNTQKAASMLQLQQTGAMSLMPDWSAGPTAVAEVAAADGRTNGGTSNVLQTLSFCGAGARFDAVPAPGKQNITVASMFIGHERWPGLSGVMDAVQQNHVDFCRHHQLSYFAPKCSFGAGKAMTYGFFNSAARELTWSKFALIQYLFDSGADTVFWIDADAVFLNFEMNLNRFLETGRDLTFAGNEEVNFNAGVFLIRNTPWSTQFMRDSYAICPAPGWNDNGAMMVILGGGRPEDPSGWSNALKKSMLDCAEETEARGPCSTSLSESVRNHVHLVARADLNAYKDPSYLDPNKWKGFFYVGGPLPFIIHMAGMTAEDKTKLLPYFLSIADNKRPIGLTTISNELVTNGTRAATAWGWSAHTVDRFAANEPC